MTAPRILVVDDELDIRELVAGVLEDEGYETRMAGDSDAALDAIATRRPSLVLLAAAAVERHDQGAGRHRGQHACALGDGVLDVAEDMGAIVRARGMVEKPKDNPPSNLAVIGRYILQPEIFDLLENQTSGAGGEIQLTDAIADEIHEGRDVYGLRFRGQRYDCGSKAGFLQATVAFGLARDDLKDEFAEYLHDVIAMRKAAE